MEELPKSSSQEQEIKLEKDRSLKEIVDLHDEYSAFKPLLAEKGEIINRYKKLTKPTEFYEPGFKIENKFTPFDLERTQMIKEKERQLREKAEKEIKKLISFYDKNFSILDWKKEDYKGIESGRNYMTKIGGGYYFNIKFRELEPGQPFFDPVSKDKYIRSYIAEITEEKMGKIENFLEFENLWRSHVGAYIKDEKSISERQSEIEAKEDFEKELISLTNKLKSLLK